MKKLAGVLFILFFICLNAGAAAVEINSGDYEKDLKLAKTFKEKIKKLHIYGQPELKKVEFSKGKDGLCGFIVEYDKPIELGKTKFIKTDKKSLKDCADDLIGYIKRKNYFYATKELRALGAKIKGWDVGIQKIENSDFPAALIGEYLVKIILSENEFEFFICGATDPNNPIVFAGTIKEAENWLWNNLQIKIEEEVVEDLLGKIRKNKNYIKEMERKGEKNEKKAEYL